MTIDTGHHVIQMDRSHSRLSAPPTDLLGYEGSVKPGRPIRTGSAHLNSTAKYNGENRQNGLETTESVTADDAGLLSTWEYVWLEQALKEGHPREFKALWQQIDWAARRPSQIASAIRLAIAAEASILARALSDLGTILFPQDKELQTLSQVVAPPIVTTRHEAPRPDIRADRDWIQLHRPEYRGKWVALRNGELLATAETVDALVDEVGNVRNSGILITQIW